MTYLRQIPYISGTNYVHIHLNGYFNWPLYQIRYYSTYSINASKVWLLCIVHTNLSINGKKQTFPCK